MVFLAGLALNTHDFIKNRLRFLNIDPLQVLTRIPIIGVRLVELFLKTVSYELLHIAIRYQPLAIISDKYIRDHITNNRLLIAY